MWNFGILHVWRVMTLSKIDVIHGHPSFKVKWNEGDFKVQKVKRLMGLEVHGDGVKKANLLE